MTHRGDPERIYRAQRQTGPAEVPTPSEHDVIHRLRTALFRTRLAIAAVALVHLAGLAAGIGLAHAGNGFALDSRDAVVAGARASAPATTALDRGDALQAAVLDFGGNLLLGAVPTTVTGLALVVPFPIVAYRGWVGGIVSVRDDHSSRLDGPRSAAYYLSVVVLQVIPYSMTVGAGVALGFAMFRRREERRVLGVRVYVLPRQAVSDVAWIYALAIPLFLVASLWEFLSPL